MGLKPSSVISASKFASQKLLDQTLLKQTSWQQYNDSSNNKFQSEKKPFCPASWPTCPGKVFKEIVIKLREEKFYPK